MARTILMGTHNFERLIIEGCFYIDKTNFIKKWWEEQDVVTLITRPGQFGKTLNMKIEEKFLKGWIFGKKRNIENCREPIL